MIAHWAEHELLHPMHAQLQLHVRQAVAVVMFWAGYNLLAAVAEALQGMLYCFFMCHPCKRYVSAVGQA